MTVLGVLSGGLAAGVAGTGAMTAYQALVTRIRKAASDQSQSGNAGEPQGAKERDAWENAPAPAQVGRKLINAVTRRDVSPDRIGVLANGVHWSYGISWGVVYGFVQDGVEAPWVLAGLAFAVVVWLAGYVVLPLMKVYEPIWKYPLKTLAVDLSYHVVYGVATAVSFRLLEQI